MDRAGVMVDGLQKRRETRHSPSLSGDHIRNPMALTPAPGSDPREVTPTTQRAQPIRIVAGVRGLGPRQT